MAFDLLFKLVLYITSTLDITNDRQVWLCIGKIINENILYQALTAAVVPDVNP